VTVNTPNTANTANSANSDAPRITALAGGVGAARMLRGLSAVVGQANITAIVNTGDDMILHGLYISPDIDTVTYTLGGAANDETGWGLDKESWAVMDALRAFEGDESPPTASLTWFSLGDHDLATHLFRTGRLAGGATLSQVTAEVAHRFGVQARLVPMTNSRVETRVTVEMGGIARNFGGISGEAKEAAEPAPAADHKNGPGPVEVGFQEYFVGFRHSVEVNAVRFAGAEVARPAPGVLAAIAEADLVVICPSNPIVSIGPMMAVPGIADAVRDRRSDVVAVSPIIAGRALKGPADRMLSELGHEASAVGVARLWSPLAATLVVDEQDAALAARVEAEGMRCVIAPSVMSGPREAANLARAVLGAGTPG
jgi:LPPG:FO 2-phospho-L-lactate transferase